MCLAIIAFQVLEDWPLIIVANRDEYHARPTLAAQPWSENPQLLAGKDLEAGGSWFGVTQTGHVALLTNYREPSVAKQTATSRGKLVTNYLMHLQKPLSYLQTLKDHAHLYSGFNLLVGDRLGLFVASNRSAQEGGLAQHAFEQPISKGVWGLSNAFWNTPWPKLTLTRDSLKQYLLNIQQHRNQPHASALMNIMQDIVPVPDSLLPQTGLSIERERQLATPFIIGKKYGTRSTTVLMQHNNGHILFQEQSYTPGALTPNKAVSWKFNSQQAQFGWQSIAS
jgi:uncharacterized protein with NRDE domain